MKPSIQAGAGTGKTTKVVALLLDRLLRTDTEPSRLLGLTFTVRAANEMRDRLGTWLARLMTDQPVDELGGGIERFDDVCAARRRGDRALAELDRIEIGTIHSFAAHLLRQYPVEAGVSPDFMEDDGTAEASLFRELWPQWLDGRLQEAGQTDVLVRFLERCEMGELRAFAGALCKEGVPLEHRPQSRNVGAWNARLQQAAARAQQILDAHGEGKRVTERRALEALRYVVHVLTVSAVTPALRRQARVLDAQWPLGRDWKVSEAAFRELRRLARAVLDCDEEEMARLLCWLRPFAEAFRRAYTRRGYVSFAGLLVRAARLLREHVDIRQRLKHRFRLVLVDEFQDTDPLQGEILLYLTERLDRCAPDWGGVQVEPGKLVIVGDEKQSIYLFRGADLEAYQEITRRLTGGETDAVERLSVNYRSRRELVRFVNAVGRRTMRAPMYVPIEPSPACGAGGRIEIMLFPGMDADSARRAEAQAIGDWVVERVERGCTRPGDVAVLLRSLTQAHHYTEAFRRRGIEFVIEGEKQFYATQEVVDVLNLLGAIADPVDELAVVGLLRSPLGAVRDGELLALRTAHALCPLDHGRVPDRLSHVRDLYLAIAELHGRSRRIPARDLIAEVFERFPVLELAQKSQREEQAVANLRKLAEAIGVAREQTLAAALLECRRRFREGDDEGEAVLGDAELDAVRIMSIHKAKGLEFPVVVLPDLHRARTRSERQPVLQEWLTDRLGLRCGGLCNRDWVSANERYRVIEEEETRRLLYVALTRARDCLLLTGGNPGRGPLGVIISALAEEGLTVDPGQDRLLRGEGYEVLVRGRHDGGPVRRMPARHPARDERDYRREHERWSERRRQRDQIVKASPLRHPSAVSSAEGEGSVVCGVRLPRGDETVEAASVGSRCHDVLARMDLAHPELVTTDADVRDILEMFFATEAFREIQQADRIEREVPFVIELGDGIWSGQVDVLYCRDGRWIVADYKSDRQEVPGRYRAQAHLYARAVQRALGLAARPEFRLIYLRTGRVVRM